MNEIIKRGTEKDGGKKRERGREEVGRENGRINEIL